MEALHVSADRALAGLVVLIALMQLAWIGERSAMWRIAGTSLLIAVLCAWNGSTLLRCLGPSSVQPQRSLRVLLGLPFAMRTSAVLLAHEQLISNGQLENSVSLLGALVWLFISLGMALVVQVAYQMQRPLSLAATHDVLTGLLNRRAADEFLAQEALRAQPQGAPLSVLMIDIDFFKKVNDQYGHAGGDHVLRSLAQLLKQRARASDMTARWGGEEFLLLLPDTPHQGACAMAEQLRLAVQSHPFQWQQQKVPITITITITITISVGAATWSGGPLLANALIAEADNALYRAKNTGRNRVCGADQVASLPAC